MFKLHSCHFLLPKLISPLKVKLYCHLAGKHEIVLLMVFLFLAGGQGGGEVHLLQVLLEEGALRQIGKAVQTMFNASFLPNTVSQAAYILSLFRCVFEALTLSLSARPAALSYTVILTPDQLPPDTSLSLHT